MTKQVVQELNNGRLRIAEIPEPVVRPGAVLVLNARSVVSAGTEKMTMELAQKSLLGKARERPDQVRRVLEKLRQEGFFQTLAQVREKLDEPMTLGYSSAGTVLAVGAGVEGFKPGDRVASNGPHAGVVCVPKHLCARVPAGVPFDHAAFTVLGAIALQGVRLSRVEIGSVVYVIGLGLIGQITVALLRAQGCRVVAVDLDASRCELALRMGAEAAHPRLDARAATEASSGRGADAVIITASARSNGPIEQAVEAVRKKGRIVLVGVVGLELDRRPFYFKECEFVVSSSYGPGRYDPSYEERGHDYPPAYVRWTEQRNMQAVLDLMASGRLDVSPLITHRFPIERALRAYELIEKGCEPYLGIVLEYPEVSGETGRRLELRPAAPVAPGKVGAGVVGAGNFARSVLIPAICGDGAFEPRVICSAGGLSAAHTGGKRGFAAALSEAREVYGDPSVGAVFIATRHNEHAAQVCEALRAGKHVFVEKPLALTVEELAQIEKALSLAPDRILMVGFNRRFAPATVKVKEFFSGVSQPLTVSIRFNAGMIPPEHWTQDERAGGGRIIGEACHAIDLATFLVDSPPVRVFAESIGGPQAPEIRDDQVFITLRHANGAISSIGYLAGGDKAFPKERIEVIGGGRVAVIDDFRTVTTCAGGRTRTNRLGRQDKGHRAEIRTFARALSAGGAWPITWEELRAVSLASILAVRSLREGVPSEI
jgi:predicted dehydrogenase/threonine dehydrogenase-like Zn-dependent dehydrogenase